MFIQITAYPTKQIVALNIECIERYESKEADGRVLTLITMRSGVQYWINTSYLDFQNQCEIHPKHIFWS